MKGLKVLPEAADTAGMETKCIDCGDKRTNYLCEVRLRQAPTVSVLMCAFCIGDHRAIQDPVEVVSRKRQPVRPWRAW